MMKTDEPWPSCACGSPLLLVAQINTEKLPQPFRKAKYMWQIFACATCNKPTVRSVSPTVAGWKEQDAPVSKPCMRVEKWIENTGGDCMHPEEAELLTGKVYSRDDWVKMAGICSRGPKLGGCAVWLQPLVRRSCSVCGVNLRHCLTLEADQIKWGGCHESNLALFCCLEHPDQLEVLVLLP